MYSTIRTRIKSLQLVPSAETRTTGTIRNQTRAMQSVPSAGKMYVSQVTIALDFDSDWLKRKCHVYLLEQVMFLTSYWVQLSRNQSKRIESIKSCKSSPCNINPYQSEKPWKLGIWSAKMISLDILIISPHYFYKKPMGTRNGNV